MGIYIKDLAMPTSCNKCPFTCEKLVFFDGKNRPQGCPLIEIDLVRCGECEYADEYNHCKYSAWWNGNADFCSHGIRRKESR